MARGISSQAAPARLRRQVGARVALVLARFGWAISLGVLSNAALAPARAQTPADATPADAARAAQADQLFAEARALLDQGRYAEACAKFELSSSIEPSPGTLLNLGNCYESEGDLVRALSTFEQAFMDAQRNADPERRQAWSDAARERIARLGRRVPRLTLRGLEPGTTTVLDGQAVDASSGPLRVNPGHHVLEARAPGKLPRTRELDIGAGQHLAIDLPPLEPVLPLTVAPAPAAPPPRTVDGAGAPVQPREAQSSAPAPAPAEAAGYGPWPWVLTGTGATLLGAGLITGLTARSRSDRLDRECGGRNCDPSLADLQDSAQTLALATDVLLISGAIAAGVGVTLFVLDHGSEAADTSVQASCDAFGCGLRAAGSF